MKKSHNPHPVICFCILILFSISASAQQYNLNYILVKGTDTVGKLSVVDTKQANERIIETNLNAEVPALLFHFSIKDEKSIRFRNEVLQSATVNRRYLSHYTTQSSTILKDNYYTDGQTRLPSLNGGKQIYFSVSMLYTTEPVGIDFIYSEFHRTMVPVTYIDSNVYRIETPEGQVGQYYYDKGICVKIITKTTWAIISTILVNNKIALK